MSDLGLRSDVQPTVTAEVGDTTSSMGRDHRQHGRAVKPFPSFRFLTTSNSLSMNRTALLAAYSFIFACRWAPRTNS